MPIPTDMVGIYINGKFESTWNDRGGGSGIGRPSSIDINCSASDTIELVVGGRTLAKESC